VSPGAWSEIGLSGLAPPVFALLACGLALVLLGWVAELAVTPRPQAVRLRPLAANLAHGSILVSLFGLALAITAKPGLSAALVFLLIVVLVLVNQDKQRALGEPFLACDFAYFVDVVVHPRLYLPYFGYTKAVLLTIAALVMALTWWRLEPSLIMAGHQSLTHLLGLVLALGAAALATQAARRLSPSITLNPETDLRGLGFLAMLLAYRTRAAKAKPELYLQDTKTAAWVTRLTGLTRLTWLDPAKPVNPTQSSDSPLLVSVQLESFVDFRRVYPALAQTAHAAGLHLPGWDRLRANAWATGTLAVPAFGANTVRTEFEFLTGLPTTALGVHGFEPYQLIAHHGAHHWNNALPASLARLGLRTCLMHPYDGRFYQRHRVAPKLGFETFIDLNGFKTISRRPVTNNATRPAEHPLSPTGYVRDTTLGQAILQHVATLGTQQAAFVHAISMQGHGPYAQGRLRRDPDAMLAGYLAGLRDTDRMLTELVDALAQMPRPTVLCVFGDHLPIMPELYRVWGTPPSHTDYAVWHNQPQRLQPQSLAHHPHHPNTPSRLDCASHELATLMLKASGLIELPQGERHG